MDEAQPPADDGAPRDPLRAARERVVREHMDSEERGDFDATVATFGRPRYEVTPTGEAFDGAATVRAFLAETGAAFPGFRFELHAMHHADDAVIVEATFHGTHRGAWRGLPATGRAVAYRMANVFVFEGDRLVCERLHFDRLAILQQLGIARDPTTMSGRIGVFFNHPLTTLRAFLGRVT